MPDNVANNIAAAVDAKTNPGAIKPAVDTKAPDAKSPVVDPNAGKEKYVVDGKEIFLTPEQAKAYVQKGISFEPKISQLGRLQQETAAFLDTLVKDPGKVIFNEKFGQPDEVLAKILNSTKVSDKIKDVLGQWYYNNVVVKENMTPQERELAEFKSKAQEYEAYKKAQEEASIKAENDRKTAAALAQIKAQISEAMQEAGVSLDSKIAPQLARRVAQVMQLGFTTGKMITPKEAMAKVRAEIMEYQKAYFDILDEDKLVEQIGKENAEKVRKYYLKQVKQADKEKSAPRPAAKKDERKTMTPDQFRDYLADLKKSSK